MNENDNLLKKLLVDEDERPDEIELERVTIDTNEFHDRLSRLAQAAEAVETLAADLQTLRQSGLTDDDVTALLYGRNSTLNKTTIETALNTADDVIEDAEGDRYAPKRKLLVRLIADISGIGKRDTAEVLDELEDVAERYGYDDLRDNGGQDR